MWPITLLYSTPDDSCHSYYGANRSKSLTPATLSEYDVILTTYPVLEYEYRQQVSIDNVDQVKWQS